MSTIEAMNIGNSIRVFVPVFMLTVSFAYAQNDTPATIPSTVADTAQAAQDLPVRDKSGMSAEDYRIKAQKQRKTANTWLIMSSALSGSYAAIPGDMSMQSVSDGQETARVLFGIAAFGVAMASLIHFISASDNNKKADKRTPENP
ncbi:MAG: hypothetical protein KDD36_01535 [Flavobacteriales bacterium]|nr:hypothetical protein [Flavobacteriales bacterium]